MDRRRTAVYLKSGIPLGVLMPAPAITTILLNRFSLIFAAMSSKVCCRAVPRGPPNRPLDPQHLINADLYTFEKSHLKFLQRTQQNYITILTDNQIQINTVDSSVRENMVTRSSDGKSFSLTDLKKNIIIRMSTRYTWLLLKHKTILLSQNRDNSYKNLLQCSNIHNS